MATADWGGHRHDISQTDYTVPTEDEFNSLASRVSDLGDDLRKVERKCSTLEQFTRKADQGFASIREALVELQSRLESTVEELKETGQLATVFKGITDKHLGNIQKASDGFSLKLRDAEKTLAGKISDSQKVITEGIQKCHQEAQGVIRIRDQVISELQKAAADVQNRLSKFIDDKSCALSVIADKVHRDVVSVEEAQNAITRLVEESEGLGVKYKELKIEQGKSERAILALRQGQKSAHDEAVRKLSEVEHEYQIALETCKDALSGARYFAEINRSFFSRLWWCLTGHCKADETKEG